MNTVSKNIEINGRGIHSGLPVKMVIKPSNRMGIFFRRIDMAGTGLVPALYNNVGETKMRNTTVGQVNSAHVQTVEHLMAALFMCGVDSAIIEIDGPETPILDGSAAEFIKEFEKVGVTEGGLKKIVVKREVTVYAKEVLKQLPKIARLKIWFFNKISGRKQDGFVKLSPNDGGALNVKATLIYPEKIIGAQTYE